MVPIVRNKEIHEWNFTFWSVSLGVKKEILTSKTSNCPALDSQRKTNPGCQLKLRNGSPWNRLLWGECGPRSMALHSRHSGNRSPYSIIHDGIPIMRIAKFQNRILLVMSQFSFCYTLLGHDPESLEAPNRSARFSHHFPQLAETGSNFMHGAHIKYCGWNKVMI
jgi:hypothetical protein